MRDLHNIPALRAINERASVRSFLPVPVSDDAIHALLAAAVCAPTAMHREPWAFVVVQDRRLLADISECAKSLFAGVRPPTHASASLPAASGFAELLASPTFNLFRKR